MPESGETEFGLRFWGVRGSLPVPGPATARFGGNTACMEIRAGDATVVIDCGSGAYRLGKDLLARGKSRAHLLFTHAHLDHIVGFPAFRPAYEEGFDLRCWAAYKAQEPMDRVLRSLTAPAIWPLGPVAVDRCRFSYFEPGRPLEIEDGVRVLTQRLNHPGGATGYRVEYGGSAIAIVTDHEHGEPDIDAEIAAFVGKADVMVYDACYTQEEYPDFRGWGHSTWETGLALARQADVAIPVMFHHAPDRSDDELEAMSARAARSFPAALAAREGLIVRRGADNRFETCIGRV